MKNKLSQSEKGQHTDMQNYYKFQAKIYDATRWTFLYGRNLILKLIPLNREANIKILEVGCGTGINLHQLAKIFPKAELTGLDVSQDMIDFAQKKMKKEEHRCNLLAEPYKIGDENLESYDVILFSYSLTMINPQWNELILQAKKDLKKGGFVAVVDFHDANYNFYRKFMQSNHVNLSGHLMPFLKENFNTQIAQVKTGLLGVWEYMLYIGEKE